MPLKMLRMPASPSMVAAKSSQPKPLSSNSYASSRVTVATAFSSLGQVGEKVRRERGISSVARPDRPCETGRGAHAPPPLPSPTLDDAPPPLPRRACTKEDEG